MAVYKINESKKVTESYSDGIVSIDQLREAIRSLEELVSEMEINDIDSIKASPNTYGLGSFFLGTSSGYINLNDIYRYMPDIEDYEEGYNIRSGKMKESYSLKEGVSEFSTYGDLVSQLTGGDDEDESVLHAKETWEMAASALKSNPKSVVNLSEYDFNFDRLSDTDVSTVEYLVDEEGYLLCLEKVEGVIYVREYDQGYESVYVKKSDLNEFVKILDDEDNGEKESMAVYKISEGKKKFIRESSTLLKLVKSGYSLKEIQKYFKDETGLDMTTENSKEFKKWAEEFLKSAENESLKESVDNDYRVYQISMDVAVPGDQGISAYGLYPSSNGKLFHALSQALESEGLAMAGDFIFADDNYEDLTAMYKDNDYEFFEETE